jgi:S-adenosylmethionine:tRNA ribosyltransferase-isomerase
MVVRADGLDHRTFVELPACLRPDDVLVINETQVVRARLRGVREPGGGAAEVLLLRPASGGAFDFAASEWHALVKPGRKLRRGAVIRFGDDALARIVDERGDGSRIVRFGGPLALDDLLERHGELPLPPYVGAGTPGNARRYQTMFARVPGSVAAPTASLHFTPRVLAAIEARGVRVVPLVLDIGYGTFKPIESETIDAHVMHAERYEIPEPTAAAVNAARAEGRRVVVAGTTALRALEASALASGDGRVVPGAAEASLFITPGFRFRVASALLTNFHLPGSTLLVLVSAFAGYERIVQAYREAVRERYRFFSFGDAMFLEAQVP